MLNKTKIIATIGPSSNHPHIIKGMMKKGINVARLNMAHKSSDEDIFQTPDYINVRMIDPDGRMENLDPKFENLALPTGWEGSFNW